MVCAYVVSANVVPLLAYLAEDTMELKYEVVGKEKKENLTVTVILYIVTPVVALLLLAYTAVSLYWTKVRRLRIEFSSPNECA